jgi:hypothetical protein
MNRHEQKRIIEFLRKKQCTPCRNGSLDLVTAVASRRKND